MTACGFVLAPTPPLAGRYLLPDDERDGAAPMVVIGTTRGKGNSAAFRKSPDA